MTRSRSLLDALERGKAQIVEFYAGLAPGGAKLLDQLLRVVVRAFASSLSWDQAFVLDGRDVALLSDWTEHQVRGNCAGAGMPDIGRDEFGREAPVWKDR